MSWSDCGDMAIQAGTPAFGRKRYVVDELIAQVHWQDDNPRNRGEK